MGNEYKSRVYTDRPAYADFQPAEKFNAIQSIIVKRLTEHPNTICSYSGGSDSDIMIDLIERTRQAFNLPKVQYCFFNTGLEMKAMNCKRCREEFVNKQYNFFVKNAHTMCCFSTAAVLAVMMKRGRSKEYIKKLYEDIKLMYDLPQIDGKEITMTEVMHQLETEYGIDFDEIKLNLETRKEFKHDIQG